jgi:hypothetical protein
LRRRGGRRHIVATRRTPRARRHHAAPPQKFAEFLEPFGTREQAVRAFLRRTAPRLEVRAALRSCGTLEGAYRHAAPRSCGTLEGGISECRAMIVRHVGEGYIGMPACVLPTP